MSHDDKNAGALLSQVALVTPSPSMELVNQKRAHTVDPSYLVELAREVIVTYAIHHITYYTVSCHTPYVTYASHTPQSPQSPWTFWQFREVCI